MQEQIKALLEQLDNEKLNWKGQLIYENKDGGTLDLPLHSPYRRSGFFSEKRPFSFKIFLIYII